MSATRRSSDCSRSSGELPWSPGMPACLRADTSTRVRVPFGGEDTVATGKLRANALIPGSYRAPTPRRRPATAANVARTWPGSNIEVHLEAVQAAVRLRPGEARAAGEGQQAAL